MMSVKKIRHQVLPTKKIAREELRNKGQFWTPTWIADAMVLYCLQNHDEIFDPAIGEGAFLHAAKRQANQLGKKVHLHGGEIDESVVKKAQEGGLTTEDLINIEMRDFILNPPTKKIPSIVANPPYIRHHRLSMQMKEATRSLSINHLGKAIDGRAGLHIYFLIQALSLLEPKGRLAFIMPADTCEGVFAHDLWNWIVKNFKLDAVVTFAHNASPFPGVDTNPVIFFISAEKPSETFHWARCNEWGTDAIYWWVNNNFLSAHEQLNIHTRTIEEGISTGLSRDPQLNVQDEISLAKYAKVIRGIATGANEFFFLTDTQVKELKIPKSYLQRAVGRTRDASKDLLTKEDLKKLNLEDRPTYLLNIKDEKVIEQLPDSLKTYVKQGESQELHKRALIKTRKPWFKMEQRSAPPILFAYLGRRNARFILNKADVVPLTGFLCIYPYSSNPTDIENLWRALNHEDTLANLKRVGKSYGDGAIKVEPKNLQKLPIPKHVLDTFGL